MGPNPEPVAPTVLKLFRTDEKCNETDPRAQWLWNPVTRQYEWYLTEITAIYQGTVTASDRGATQSYDVPAGLGETPPTPATGSSINPLLAPEQSFPKSYMESQLGIWDAENWFDPLDPLYPQQTGDLMSYPV